MHSMICQIFLRLCIQYLQSKFTCIVKNGSILRLISVYASYQTSVFLTMHAPYKPGVHFDLYHNLSYVYKCRVPTTVYEAI